jgi:hypothetical protein
MVSSGSDAAFFRASASFASASEPPSREKQRARAQACRQGAVPMVLSTQMMIPREVAPWG